MDLASLMQGAQAAGITPQGPPQGGGGGQPMPQGAMPQGGGGAMPQGMPMGMPMGGGGNGVPSPGGGGGDMAGQLMQIAEMIMSSPQGQQMVQALLTQMTPQAPVGPGQPPVGGPPDGGMPMDMAQAGGPQGGPQGGPPMSTEAELALAQQMMGKKKPNDMSDDDGDEEGESDTKDSYDERPAKGKDATRRPLIKR